MEAIGCARQEVLWIRVLEQAIARLTKKKKKRERGESKDIYSR